MNISTVAGQPIEFWIAMVDADAQNALLSADSAPTLAVASKNGVDFTPGGGEMVIGTVASQRGYYMVFTPATLPAIADTYYFVFNYVISGVTYKLRYYCVVVAAESSGTTLNANYTIQVRPALASGSELCDREDRRKYNLEARKGDTKTFSIPVYEDDGVTPFDFTGLTLRVVIEPGSGSAIDRQVIENANITVAENVVSFTTSTCNAIAGVSETLSWALQKITTSPATKMDLLYGDYYVRRGVAKD